MIYDLVGNLKRYAAACPGLEKAIDWLENADLGCLPAGRQEIDGDNCYAMVFDYATSFREEPAFEAHKRYIDVQTLAAGEEAIGFLAEGEGTVTEEYDSGKDVFMLAAGEYEILRIRPGTAAVFLPDEPHAPALAADRPAPVRKVVVKIRVPA